jgi:hypothetical protein
MKFLLLPDLHTTEKTPKNRTDDFEKTVLRKMGFIYETAEKYKVENILQPGDFTDSYTMSWKFYIKLIKKIIKTTYTVHGQHSLRYRTSGNTVLDGLQEALNNLILLNSDQEGIPPCDKSGTPDFSIRIYGAGYDEKVPKPKTKRHFNILLVHKMIVSNKKVWEGQKEITWAKNFLRKNEDYDLIVSGDNHSQFEVEYGGRFLFNCGTLLRDGIDYIDYKPYIVLFDTEGSVNSMYKKIYIPIESASEVFNLSKIKEEKENDKKIEEFIAGIKESKNVGLNYKSNLFKHIKENNIGSEVKDIFKKAFEEIGSNSTNE